MEFLISMLVQCLGYVVSELILSTFFFLCGWPVVRLFTLGRYPAHSRPDGSRADSYVCCVGLVVFCLLLLALCSQF
ncbi:hypothetical protein [Stutzerimonas nitrititolerans]|uniref:hypothetical protein n=1 Tax=Stutzerimonas nitrititolerans TaxID=2482751 RepID=UPI0015E2AC8A|nr:hypothetical protein [Stutzerimonas nitrititolerans]MBA1186823.1 hypothetical protein [Stutzerimonas stutzeri]